MASNTQLPSGNKLQTSADKAAQEEARRKIEEERLRGEEEAKRLLEQEKMNLDGTQHIPDDAPDGKGDNGKTGGSQENIIAQLLSRNEELQEALEDKDAGIAGFQATVTEELKAMSLAMKAIANKVTELDVDVRGIKTAGVNGVAPATVQDTATTEDSVPSEFARQMAALLGVSEARGQSAQPKVAYGNDTEDSTRGRTIKSGRELRAENIVVREVPWPHHKVYRIPNLKGAEYDDLTVSEFTFGYLAQAHENKYAEVREHMLKHLSTLLEDEKDFEDAWELIRSFHALVLTHMERGLLTWEDSEEIKTLRLKYVFAMHAKRNQVTPCTEFNKGTCESNKDHANLKHICSHCLLTSGRHFTHAQIDCFKLNGPPKQTKPTTEAKTAP